MKQASWQAGQVHAFEAFGGVPRMLIPDNAATAVNRGVRWVTCVNEEYERFAEHYQTAVLPTRVRRPRDKSVAESVVDLVERWIIAPANEHRFYSISEFNEFCADKVAWLNTRPFTAKEGSRQSVFEAEEQDQLLALPDTPYEMCRWRSAKVGPDYHVRIDHMRYSVPHTLIGTQVDIKESTTTITIMVSLSPNTTGFTDAKANTPPSSSTCQPTMLALTTHGQPTGSSTGPTTLALKPQRQSPRSWLHAQSLNSPLWPAATF